MVPGLLFRSSEVQKLRSPGLFSLKLRSSEVPSFIASRLQGLKAPMRASRLQGFKARMSFKTSRLGSDTSFRASELQDFKAWRGYELQSFKTSFKA